jgi:hypothetical protein
VVRSRARVAGIETGVGRRTSRATADLGSGGTLERARQVAARESPRATKLHDRTSDQITLDEIERIAI